MFQIKKHFHQKHNKLTIIEWYKRHFPTKNQSNIDKTMSKAVSDEFVEILKCSKLAITSWKQLLPPRLFFTINLINPVVLLIMDIDIFGTILRSLWRRKLRQTT